MEEFKLEKLINMIGDILYYFLNNNHSTYE